MSGVEALPLVHGFARSDDPERACAIRARLSRPARRARARGEATVPQDWGDALQSLSRKMPAQRERDGYLADLAEGSSVHRAGDSRAGARQRRRRSDARRRARPPRSVDRAGRRSRGAAAQPSILHALARARADARRASGDRRLAEALLAREPAAAGSGAAVSGGERRAARGDPARGAARRSRPPKPPRAEPRRGRRRAGWSLPPSPATSGDFAEALGRRARAPTSHSPSASPPIPSASRSRSRCSALGAPRDVCVRIMTARDMQEGDGFPRVHTLARLSDRLSPRGGAADRRRAARTGRRTRATPAVGARRAARQAGPSLAVPAPRGAARKPRQPRNDSTFGAR